MLETKILEITPALAEQWLAEHNTRNRGLTRSLVDRYAGAITRNEWQLNGDPIRFDADGFLLDGQHRLAAVVKAQQPITSIVISGLPPSTQDTMDLGKRRSFADVLALRGEAHAITLAAAIHVLYRLANERWSGMDYPTYPQSLALLKANPALRESLPIGERVYRRTTLRASVAAALHYHFSHLGDDQAPADAKDFFERFASGADLSEGSPILALRKAIRQHRDDRKTLGTARMVALTIKAWNAYRDGRSVSFIRFSPGGAQPESFPKAR